MKDGEITAYGETQKILTPEKIKEIFEVDASIKNIENENIVIYNSK